MFFFFADALIAKKESFWGETLGAILEFRCVHEHNNHDYLGRLTEERYTVPCYALLPNSIILVFLFHLKGLEAFSQNFSWAENIELVVYRSRVL